MDCSMPGLLVPHHLSEFVQMITWFKMSGVMKLRNPVAEEAGIMSSVVMWKVFAKSNARRYALIFVLLLFSGRLLDFREQLGMNL